MALDLDLLTADPNALARALQELERRTKVAGLVYEPYPKQLEFHNAQERERMLFAGNQSGKTWAAGYETSYHATGLYPKWFTGKRFDHAVSIWVGSQSYAAQRQAAQLKLLGTLTPLSTPEFVGTGAIPRECIVKITAARGVPDSVDTILIRHKSGLISTLTFKTYDQELAKWAGGTIHVLWCDEEPPLDMYVEGLMRISATRGIIYTTFTPLSGRTPLVNRFLSEVSQDRFVVVMSAYDVKHKTKEEVDQDLRNLPVWEREARIFGRPAAGQGRIFQMAEDQYVMDPVKLETYWPRIIGLDIGTLHPTAAIWMAHDLDRNRLLVYDEYRQKELKVSEHSGVLMLRGAGEIPVAWPQDAYQRDQGSLEPIVEQYRKLGLNMLRVHAASKETGNSLWASVADVTTRMNMHQLKIFRSCTMLREELMMYHQQDGKIVPIDDDLIAAMRYATMMHKKAVVLTGQTPGEKAFRAHVERRDPPGLDLHPHDR